MKVDTKRVANLSQVVVEGLLVTISAELLGLEFQPESPFGEPASVVHKINDKQSSFSLNDVINGGDDLRTFVLAANAIECARLIRDVATLCDAMQSRSLAILRRAIFECAIKCRFYARYEHQLLIAFRNAPLALAKSIDRSPVMFALARHAGLISKAFTAAGIHENEEPSFRSMARDILGNRYKDIIGTQYSAPSGQVHTSMMHAFSFLKEFNDMYWTPNDSLEYFLSIGICLELIDDLTKLLALPKTKKIYEFSLGKIRSEYEREFPEATKMFKDVYFPLFV